MEKAFFLILVNNFFFHAEDPDELETYFQPILDLFTMYISSICAVKSFMTLGVRVSPTTGTSFRQTADWARGVLVQLVKSSF